MSDDLKNCPFCGKSASAAPLEVGKPKGPWAVLCDGRHDGSCLVRQFCFPTKRKAIAAWNRRSPDTEAGRLRAIETAAREMIAAFDDDGAWKWRLQNLREALATPPQAAPKTCTCEDPCWNARGLCVCGGLKPAPPQPQHFDDCGEDGGCNPECKAWRPGLRRKDLKPLATGEEGKCPVCPCEDHTPSRGACVDCGHIDAPAPSEGTEG